MNIFSRLYSAIRFAFSRNDSLPWEHGHDECPHCGRPAAGKKDHQLCREDGRIVARQINVVCEHCGGVMEVLRAARRTC